MKVIDLLNKIANNDLDKEIKHIKYYDRNDEENDICMLCYENLIFKLDNGSLDLNDEVEIKEDKKIEKIETTKNVYDATLNCNRDIPKNITNNELADKINEIIDKLNEVDKC